MILKKMINFISRTQNNILEESGLTLDQRVIEDFSTSKKEVSEVKNIFKIGTLLPLEPSLYSPIHLLREEKTN